MHRTTTKQTIQRGSGTTVETLDTPRQHSSNTPPRQQLIDDTASTASTATRERMPVTAQPMPMPMAYLEPAPMWWPVLSYSCPASSPLSHRYARKARRGLGRRRQRRGDDGVSCRSGRGSVKTARCVPHDECIVNFQGGDARVAGNKERKWREGNAFDFAVTKSGQEVAKSAVTGKKLQNPPGSCKIPHACLAYPAYSSVCVASIDSRSAPCHQSSPSEVCIIPSSKFVSRHASECQCLRPARPGPFFRTPAQLSPPFHR